MGGGGRRKKGGGEWVKKGGKFLNFFFSRGRIVKTKKLLTNYVFKGLSENFSIEFHCPNVQVGD